MDQVRDILADKGATVHAVGPEETVFEAIRRMDELNVGALVVTRTGRGDPYAGLVGLVTERDYLRHVALLGRTSRETAVSDIMTRRVRYVQPDCPVADALAIMTEMRCRHLPVIEDGRIVGVISIGDCVKQIIHAQGVRIGHLEQYIADEYPGPSRIVA